jgi:hypothetical protein
VVIAGHWIQRVSGLVAADRNDKNVRVLNDLNNLSANRRRARQRGNTLKAERKKRENKECPIKTGRDHPATAAVDVKVRRLGDTTLRCATGKNAATQFLDIIG